ncbi:DoxX family protein [Bailinhaonella thermotolerans]|uniref:DoxX family protein n=1 Tax=Bailinhaonella thermotolerans TaxID=1070861 RepID=A0A3A4AWW3_9ACTN|nr:DoxX family protein [Bailinhaonella thermotolerans]RJL34435.1 DoxX family protein [Bailinhaonella thermotolerans]
MRRWVYDMAALAARLGVGGIFISNGWEKLEAGLAATSEQFGTLGAPAPDLWAAGTMLIEVVGGLLLFAGFMLPLTGMVLFAEALAVFFVGAGRYGLPLTGGDIKLIVALGAAAVLLAVGGAGRVSFDHLVLIRRREAAEAAAEEAADEAIARLRGEQPDGEPTRESPREAPTSPGRRVRDTAGPGGDAAGETPPARPGGAASGDGAAGTGAAGTDSAGGTRAAGDPGSASGGRVPPPTLPETPKRGGAPRRDAGDEPTSTELRSESHA